MIIFWSAVSAILVFYFRECLKLAHVKQEIAARLEAYLHHWSLKLLEGNDGIFKLTSIGYRWADKYRKCKTTQDILDVDVEMNSKLDEMKKELIDGEALSKYINEIRINIKSDSSGINIAYKMLSEYRRDIIDGKIFPIDSDLAKLGARASKMTVSMKLDIISLIESVMILIKRLESEPENTKEHEIIWKLYTDWLKLNRDKKLIMQYTEKELSKSPFNLAIEHFVSGL